MRKLLFAALAGATVAGGAMIGQAQAQPYYYGPPAYGYSPYYSNPYAYQDPRYRAPYGYQNYGYSPYNRSYSPYGYNSYYGSQGGLGTALSVLGSVLGLNYAPSFYSGVPVDQYGPDPNGMIGPDGRRIKCKLRRSYDRYYGRSIVRRECWTR